jgi:acyl homoserine lactone synthase
MIQLITPDRHGAFVHELSEMHRLRYRLQERLGWDVEVSGDMEIDAFDACQPVYLLQRNVDGRVQGCVPPAHDRSDNAARYLSGADGW